MQLPSIKFLLLFIAIFFVISCSSSPIKPSEGVEKEISAGASKDILMARSLAWVEKRRIDRQSIVKLNHQQDGIIIGTGITTIENSLELKNVFRFVMTIKVEDNRAKIMLNNIALVEGVTDESFEGTLKLVMANLTNIAESYERAITTEVK